MTLLLSEMPERVLETIIEHLDFSSIMKLRGVCHNLKNYMDDENSDFGITFVSIHMNSNKNELWLNFKSGAQLHVQYLKHQDGCKMVKDQKERVIENMDYCASFFQNLQMILHHQTELLLNLTISTHTVPKQLTETLESLITSLKVKTLLMKTTHQSQVLKVLPFLDLSMFKELEVYELRQSVVQELWKIDQLVQSNYWKRAEKFSSLSFYVDVPMEHFIHLNAAYFMVASVSAEEVDLLKRNFLLSSTFKYCYFGYQHFTDQEKLLEIFGAPYITEELNKKDQKRWYFQFPDNSVLCILLLPGMVYFTRVGREEVPKGAIVQFS